ncbi:MAG: hypothetical protein ABW039_05515 [Sphingobium sp.]
MTDFFQRHSDPRGAQHFAVGNGATRKNHGLAQFLDAVGLKISTIVQRHLIDIAVPLKFMRRNVEEKDYIISGIQKMTYSVMKENSDSTRSRRIYFQ